MNSFATRAAGALAVCSFALALAGCNGQHSGELAAGAGSTVAASLPAQAETPATPIFPDGVPIPPVRPDFAKLARDKAQAPQQQAAATQPSADAPPAADGTTTVPRAIAEAPPAPKPTGIFAAFAGAPSDPAAPVQVAAAPSGTTNDADPAPRGSLGAYERRLGGEDAIAVSPRPAAGGSSLQIAPAAVIEVAGVTRELPRSMSPALVGVSPSIAGTFGMGGQNWRPAYDNVVTNCFGPDLRAALENIARHFNSEVLVTSGARTNGRRKSMHRSCRAADIRVVGVSPGTVARYASGVPGINGVGTYRRVAVTHIDTRENRMAWRY